MQKNKIKYLFVNGCSFVAGVNAGEYLGISQDDERVKDLRFSKILSDKLGIEEINLAKGGESNEYSIRTTFDWIENNKDKVNETLFILGVTETSRIEFFLTQSKNFQTSAMSWVIANYENKYNIKKHEHPGYSPEHTIPRLFGTDTISADDGLEWFINYIKYFYDENERGREIERQYKMLESFINKYGGKLILFNSVYDVIDDKDYFNFFNFPCEKNYWKEYNWIMQSSGKNWKTSCTHPSHLSHKWFAEKLYDFVGKIL